MYPQHAQHEDQIFRHAVDVATSSLHCMDEFCMFSLGKLYLLLSMFRTCAKGVKPLFVYNTAQ